MPTRLEYIQAYAKGWTEGDPRQILEACAPGYFFDDPKQNIRVRSPQFEAYCKKLVIAANDAHKEPSATFMEITDVLVSPDQSLVYCWWGIPALAVQGAGLIRVSDRGVESERIAYYA